jgi:hypothetical protein
MNSQKTLLLTLATLSCVPPLLLSATMGLLKISHGDRWGKNNFSFLLLFCVIFELGFVPLAVRSRRHEGQPAKRLLDTCLRHIALGALVGYCSSVLAYYALVILGGVFGRWPVGDASNVMYVAEALVLNTYGWLCGIVAFLIFDFTAEIFFRQSVTNVDNA